MVQGQQCENHIKTFHFLIAVEKIVVVVVTVLVVVVLALVVVVLVLVVIVVVVAATLVEVRVGEKYGGVIDLLR
jgi:hypothetical protein